MSCVVTYKNITSRIVTSTLIKKDNETVIEIKTELNNIRFRVKPFPTECFKKRQSIEYTIEKLSELFIKINYNNEVDLSKEFTDWNCECIKLYGYLPNVYKEITTI